LVPLPLVWVGYHAFTRRGQLESLGWLLMVQLVAIAVITVSQYSGATDVNTASAFNIERAGYSNIGIIRPPGTFSAPGHLGMYILFTILFGFGLLGLRTPNWKRMGFVVGLAASVAALIVNSQRATVVLLAIAIPLTLMQGRNRKVVVTSVVALAVVVAGSVVGSQFAGGAFLGRLASIREDASSTLIEAPRERMADALQNPVIGGGLGIATPGVGRFLLPNFATSLTENLSVKPAEAFMAALVYQTGVPGLILFYVFIAAILVQGMRAVRACRNSDMALLAAAIFSYEIAICIQSWSYDPLHFPPSRVLFWFWAGALMSLPRLARVGFQIPGAAEIPRVLQRRLRSPRPARSSVA
jgi:hypothetical protein